MSGHLIRTDKDRRSFLKYLAAALPGMAMLLDACKSAGDTYGHINGSIVGADHNIGHLLRTPDKIPAPVSDVHTNILIAGGGIAGLSAARWLTTHGQTDLTMLEMAGNLGGNSSYGKNKYSAYPWAAHYLPVPDNENTELIDFLKSSGVITREKNGLPVYNQYHLCHDPEERLYINGHWQEGIIPHFGVSQSDKEQIKRFFAYIEALKHAKGEDGKYHFAIPVDNSSSSQLYKELDRITFADFLSHQGYTSQYLLWYLEYCCKDDYGSLLQHTSAWAGLHYFASRRGMAANANSSDVLTWPEGNGFLMDALKQQSMASIKTGMLIYHVETTTDSVKAFCYDTAKKSSVCIHANKILLCTPQYINKHILPGADARSGIYSAASYAPWIVANITLRDIPQTKGVPLSWDNVVYGRNSVGYVYANHQDVKIMQDKGVITYYLPVTGRDTTIARRQIYDKDYAHWKKYIIEDLEFAHPGIAKNISHIDVCVWGHGMIRPDVGYIWGDTRRQALKPIDDKIFFAHSDLSGISIFEEAFYQGIRAAKEILHTV